MDEQDYYKLMASYLSKRDCGDSFVRYFLGAGAGGGGAGALPRRSAAAAALERADERKRRLQRERSRRYRALKSQRRAHTAPEPRAHSRARAGASTPLPDEFSDDADEPPTLCDLSYGAGSDCPSDDNSAHSAPERKVMTPAAAGGGGGDGAGAGAERDAALALKELLSSPNAELDYPTVHSLMFHWLQT